MAWVLRSNSKNVEAVVVKLLSANFLSLGFLIGILISSSPAIARHTPCAAQISLYSRLASDTEKYGLDRDVAFRVLIDDSERFREEALELKLRYLGLARLAGFLLKNESLFAAIADSIGSNLLPAQIVAHAIRTAGLRLNAEQTAVITLGVEIAKRANLSSGESVCLAVEETVLDRMAQFELDVQDLDGKRIELQVREAIHRAKIRQLQSEEPPVAVESKEIVVFLPDFQQWRDSLSDSRLIKKVDDIIWHINQYGLENGVADKKTVGFGLTQIRIHQGPGYRIYGFEELNTGRVVLAAACPKPKEGRADNYSVMREAGRQMEIFLSRK